MVHWHLNSDSSCIYENGVQTQSGLAYTQRALGGNRSLGSNDNAANQFFDGNIAEAIFYNTNLNAAQRIILENYLGTKYGISVPVDHFVYDGSHGNDLAGIGRVDASNEHNAATSAGLFEISSPGSLEDDDWLLFGHDAASITTWTSSETPGDSIKRITREWRLDKTNDVGTVTISLDTASLPAKPTGYSKYVVWVDADGNFSEGTTQYVMTKNGNLYEVTGVSIADGDYVTFGVLRPVIQFVTISASGSEATTPVSVQVALNYKVAADVDVHYTVNGSGTATEGVGNDFILADGTATILAGATSTSFSITIDDDGMEESDETIIIDLSNPTSGITLGPKDTYTYTINDNDASRLIQFESASLNQPEDSTTVILTIEVDAIDAGDTITVDYTVTSGTATGSGTDYTLTNGTAKINPGDTSTTFSFTVVNDNLFENDETIIITLSNPSAGTNIGTNNQHTYTIIDNNSAPEIEFSVTSSSGPEGATEANISVTLSTISGKDASVNYAVTGGTATGGGTDYTLASGTVSITNGNLSNYIAATIIDDEMLETGETFVITLSGPTNGALGADSIHTFTIIDNDNLGFTGPGGVGDNASNILWLRADDIAGISDGGDITTWPDTSGNDNDPIQVIGANQPNWDASNSDFNYMPSVTFNGSTDFFDATALTHTASDYDAFFVYKSASAALQWVFHAANGTLRLQHEGGGNGAYNDGSAQGTEIIGITPMLVNWRLDDTGSDIYIDGTQSQTGLLYAQRAIGGNTKLGANSGGTNRFFDGNIAEVAFFNKVINDAQRVLVENYLAAKYGLTIANDKYDHEGTHPYEVAGIGSQGANNFHSAAESGKILEITGASNLDSTDYLLFGHDGVSIASWTTADVPGDSTKRISREWKFDETGDAGTVTISIDTIYLPAKPAGYSKYVLWLDADGTFNSGATQYVLIKSGGRYQVSGVNITDGSYLTIGVLKPIIQFTETVSSAAEYSSVASFEVSLNYAVATSVTVDYSVTGGTATGSGTDFTLPAGTATITAGNSTTSFDIIIIDDEAQEADETVVVTLANPISGVSLGTNTTHTFTITDDDAPRSIQFQTTSASGGEATTPITVTVELDIPDMVDTTTVDYSVTGGTATGSGTDFTLASGTITMLPGDTIETFDIVIEDDDVYENDETIIITLTNASSGVNVGTNGSFTYTINNNDAAPIIEYTTNAGSGSEGMSSANVEVYIPATSDVDAQVNYTVTGGTATGGGIDYTLASGTATITAGNTITNIVIVINDDSDLESDETIQIRLSNATDATLGDDTVFTYTIGDDDNLGSVGPGGVGDDGSNILWLRADNVTGVSDGGDITNWPDASGNGNDPTQPAAAKPSWDSVNVNFNNMATVHFDGATDFFDLSAMSHAASDYDVFAVYKATATARQWLFNSQNGTIRLAHEGGTNE